MKTFNLFLFCSILIVVSSCSSDDSADDCGDEWFQQVEAEFNTYLSATENFANNASVSTCTTFVDAANAYIDALEELRTCVPIPQKNKFLKLF